MESAPRDSLAARISDELLPRVRQPAQYLGGEINQLAKLGDWDAAEIRVAIGFPDAYTIGMSHLGCQILYTLCNQTPGVCAERTFCPWIDAEQIMRDRAIPLFTWDTRQPVASADIFAISLQYEMCFTNVLNLLDLAGIPLRAKDRVSRAGSTSETAEGGWATSIGPAAGGGEWPLVIVGGPQADNPEPMAEFVDLVVIGDGEVAMAAILEAYREYKRAGVPRQEMILRMARRFPWIYAPNLYEPTYHADGTLAGLLPLAADLPTRIERCKTPDFDAAPFPRRPIVPWIEVVHDRIGIEIMRGCPQVCRFCHAGYTKRPLTYRSPQRIVEIAEEAYWATGHDAIGLLSLSTADYPHLHELAGLLNARFTSRHVSLNFPSLRVDKMLQHIPWMAGSVRKSSITMAVEAASDDMRRAIRKKVTDGNLLDGVREVYKAGWNRLKLYFMSGFPGERPEDIEGIWRLASAVSNERRRLGKGPGFITAAVGWLVPKPFTPLQWMAQPRIEYFQEVRRQLLQLARGRKDVQVVSGGFGGYGGVADMMDGTETRNLQTGVSADRRSDVVSGHGKRRDKNSPVRIVTHDPYRSILEAVFARGDRRVGAVIVEAWRRGARFDGWDETFSPTLWRDSFVATGVDPNFYAHRERSQSELLPWDHIGLHMSRAYLEKSYDDLFVQIGKAKPLPLVTAGQP